MTLISNSDFSIDTEFCYLSGNIALFQIIMAEDPHLCQTHFTPVGFYAEGHVLEVVIVEKDTLEVIDDGVDGSVWGVP